MFELFAMGLNEYWSESNAEDAAESVAELKAVLSDHYEMTVDWNDPDVDASNKDDEISVDVIEDYQLTALQAVAAKLELDGNLDGFELDPEFPWESEVFKRIAELEDEENEESIAKFPHLLSIGNSRECICLPVDLPSVAEINIGDEDDDDDMCGCGCGHHKCDCDETCGCPGDCGCDCDCDDEDCDSCCCCEEDDGCVDISSLQALRRELDLVADGMGLDKTLDIDDDDAMGSLDAESPFYPCSIGWYLISKRVDEALAAQTPLIIRYADDDEYDDDAIDEE